MNPWLGGRWNPYEGCDTAFSGERLAEANQDEVFDVNCYDEVCPERRTDVPFYQNMPFPGSKLGHCYAKKSGHTVVQQRGMPRSAAENLCFKAPAPSTSCEHKQGMLGGLNGSALADLYKEDVQLVLPSATQGLAHAGLGLFYQGGNPVYYTAKGNAYDVQGQVHAVLNVHPDDLGGHHLVLAVGSDGVMRVDRVPLGRTDVLAQGEAGQGHSPSEIAVINSRRSNVTHGQEGWLAKRDLEMDQETVAIDRLYPVLPSGAPLSGRSWSCPLQRVAFWNRLQNAAVFDPIVPDPVRTGRLFAGKPFDMTKGTRAHPTMRSRTLASDLPRLFTSNGFCFCQDPQSCQVPRSAWSDGTPRAQCGLLATIDSASGGEERPSVSLDGAACGRQLDWPFVHGELRDGMEAGDRHKGSGQQEASCDVLDRLPLFKHAYRTVGVAANPSGRTTLDEGGSCHMGRAAGRPPAATVLVESCTVVERNATHVRAKCKPRSGGVGWTEVAMARKRSVAPTEMVRLLRRRRRVCRGEGGLATKAGPGGTCTAPPKFYDQSGANELPAGAEVSYGMPFRWSAARVLAANVRAKLCGDGEGAECEGGLNTPEWGKAKFLENLFDTPEKLFTFQVWEDGQDVLADAVRRPGRPDEARLWSGNLSKWVLCDQSTGECSGSIPEADWVAARPAARMEMCTRAIREAEVSSLLATPKNRE